MSDDIRLETINNLTAIREHDPNLDIWDQALIVEVCMVLERSIEYDREAGIIPPAQAVIPGVEVPDVAE